MISAVCVGTTLTSGDYLLHSTVGCTQDYASECVSARARTHLCEWVGACGFMLVCAQVCNARIALQAF